MKTNKLRSIMLLMAIFSLLSIITIVMEIAFYVYFHLL